MNNKFRRIFLNNLPSNNTTPPPNNLPKDLSFFKI